MNTDKATITRRMKWIVARIRAGATLRESRDVFLERSTYWLEYEDGKGCHAHEVKKSTLSKLIKANLVKSIANEPVYGKGGEFITSESVYGLVPKTVNIFDDFLVENDTDCPNCHGTGEVWETITFEDGSQEQSPAYCKCGVKVGRVPAFKEPPDDDREPIDPADYHYFNR